jgi:hypothetical protein
MVVVEDEAAFASVFLEIDSPSFTEELNIVGQWTGRLSNGGETIDLLDAGGVALHRVSYQDSGDWPGFADGDGFSLQLRDVLDDPSLASNWLFSALENGTPGVVSMEDPLTFEEWQEANFSLEELTQEEISGLFADPDRDGFSNLLEFGFGSLPLLSSSVPLMAHAIENLNVNGVSGRFATLTFERPVGSELRYALQTSSDLAAWESRPLTILRSNTELGSGIETLTVRASEPLELPNRQLMRVYLSK